MFHFKKDKRSKGFVLALALATTMVATSATCPMNVAAKTKAVKAKTTLQATSKKLTVKFSVPGVKKSKYTKVILKISTGKKFAKSETKTLTLKKKVAKKGKYTLKTSTGKVKAGKRYYVKSKVRYQVGKKSYWTKWSAVKSAKLETNASSSSASSSSASAGSSTGSSTGGNSSTSGSKTIVTTEINTNTTKSVLQIGDTKVYRFESDCGLTVSFILPPKDEYFYGYSENEKDGPEYLTIMEISDEIYNSEEYQNGKYLRTKLIDMGENSRYVYSVKDVFENGVPIGYGVEYTNSSDHKKAFFCNGFPSAAGIYYFMFGYNGNWKFIQIDLRGMVKEYNSAIEYEKYIDATCSYKGISRATFNGYSVDAKITALKDYIATNTYYDYPAGRGLAKWNYFTTVYRVSKEDGACLDCITGAYLVADIMKYIDNSATYEVTPAGYGNHHFLLVTFSDGTQRGYNINGEIDSEYSKYENDLMAKYKNGELTADEVNEALIAYVMTNIYVTDSPVSTVEYIGR